MNKHQLRFERGFSLLEMAIVLAIVGILLAGLIPSVSSQIEQQKRNETSKQLAEIKDALIGYTIANGHLPCPAQSIDPTNANYGVEQTSCTSDVASEGGLPWKSLGVSETDAWGNTRNSATDPGYWRYRVDRNFSTAFSLSTTFDCDATPKDCLLIKDSSGNNLNSTSSTSEHPVVIVYSTGPNLNADGQNASYEATSGIYQADVPGPNFDDILISISRPVVFSRMVSAGKLP